MKNYLKTLIEEKGKNINDTIEIEGHYGVTYEMLIDFIEQMPQHQHKIISQLVAIDFRNGDVFDFLDHLAKGMVESLNS